MRFTSVLLFLTLSVLTYSIPTNEVDGLTTAETLPLANEAEGLTLVEASPLAKENCKGDGKHCGGKKLSNRDAHNCKVKSKGKHYSCDKDKKCYGIATAVSKGLYNGGCYT